MNKIPSDLRLHFFSIFNPDFNFGTSRIFTKFSETGKMNFHRWSSFPLDEESVGQFGLYECILGKYEEVQKNIYGPERL